MDFEITLPVELQYKDHPLQQKYQSFMSKYKLIFTVEIAADWILVYGYRIEDLTQQKGHEPRDLWETLQLAYSSVEIRALFEKHFTNEYLKDEYPEDYDGFEFHYKREFFEEPVKIDPQQVSGQQAGEICTRSGSQVFRVSPEEQERKEALLAQPMVKPL